MGEQFEIGKNGVTYSNVRQKRTQKTGTKNFGEALRRDMTTHQVPAGAMLGDYSKAVNKLTGSNKKTLEIAKKLSERNGITNVNDLRKDEIINWDINGTPLANKPERPPIIQMTKEEGNAARKQLRGEEKSVSDALVKTMTEYTVKPGDTLSEIVANSEQIGVNKGESLPKITDEIAQQNHIKNPNDIKVGQKINWKS